MSEKYNVEKAIKAQFEYCKSSGAPHFAPNDGVCWKCGQNIYEPTTKYNVTQEIEYQIGITVKEAAESLVTGCPHCFRSYCD